MGKQEVIVDTCFLSKMSSDGASPDNIKKVLDALDYTPVVHRYVADQEMNVLGYLEKLIKEGYIRVVDKNEFIKDESDEIMYTKSFAILYKEMQEYLEAKGGLKQIPDLVIPDGETVFTHRQAGSSMGDVHMILMAAFMKLSIILTEDSDIDLLRAIAARRFKYFGFSFQIYNALELIEFIAQKKEVDIGHKELEQLVRQIGARKSWADINKMWHEVHN